MAKKNYKRTTKTFLSKNIIILLVLIVGLVATLLLMKAPEIFRNSRAAGELAHLQGVRYIAIQGKTSATYTATGSPLSMRPCSGNWNFTECFYVKNITTANVTFKYLLDCWDETKCTDQTNTMTLTPGQEVQLGFGKPCSRWQLDLNWSGAEGWDWGGVVERPGDCVAPTIAPTAAPTATPVPQACNYTTFEVK